MESDFFIIDLSIKFPTMISPFKNEMVNWPNHDQALLTLLHDVRNGDEVLLGMSYTDDFWKDFALTFSERRQLNFEPAVIAVHVDKLRSIYHDFRNNLATLQHPSMNQAEFVRLLRRCFHNEKVVKIPTKYTRRASTHYGSTFRSRPYPAQATSSSTTGSLQPSLSHEEQAEEITSVLDDLNSHHGLSVGLLVRVASFFESNHLVARTFLKKQTPGSKMDFINELVIANVISPP